MYREKCMNLSSQDLLKLEKCDGGYEVYFENNVKLGHFLMDVDGYYYWWPMEDMGKGMWAPYVLRALADKLDDLNYPWDDQIMNDPVFNVSKR